jgi:hypothetical protein
MTSKTLQLGAQDPELKNSPIAWESEEETETLREAVPGEATCFFNDRPFEHGALVRSGSVLLKCDHGLWVPAGPGDATNP